jgi:hypothetical protein
MWRELLTRDEWRCRKARVNNPRHIFTPQNFHPNACFITDGTWGITSIGSIKNYRRGTQAPMNNCIF